MTASTNAPENAVDTSRRSRRGRLPAAHRELREREIVRAAMRVIVTAGYAEATMQAIALEANASKETLYSWFGDREGLVRSVVRLNADETVAAVTALLEHQETGTTDQAQVLVTFAERLLNLLCSPVSIALNRAAMSSPALASELLQSGRHRVGPIVARFLEHMHQAGQSQHADGAAAFALLYGLLVQDTQIRVLLGEAPPSSLEIAARARWAVDAFLGADIALPAPIERV